MCLYLTLGVLHVSAMEDMPDHIIYFALSVSKGLQSKFVSEILEKRNSILYKNFTNKQ